MARCRCGNDEWMVPFRATAKVTVGNSDQNQVVLTVQDEPAPPVCGVCDRPAPMNAQPSIIDAASRLAQALPPVLLRPTYNTPTTTPNEERRLRIVTTPGAR